jgi:hypothetical protein
MEEENWALVLVCEAVISWRPEAAAETEDCGSLEESADGGRRPEGLLFICT